MRLDLVRPEELERAQKLEGSAMDKTSDKGIVVQDSRDSTIDEIQFSQVNSSEI